VADDPTAPDLYGFRLTLGERVFEWRLGDMTARHVRALRLATTLPGQPESVWTEVKVLHDILSNSGTIEANGEQVVVCAASMEAMACIAFLALLQDGQEPDWDALLDGVVGDLDASLEEMSPKMEVAADPPA
jgi:hypothetical protein